MNRKITQTKQVSRWETADRKAARSLSVLFAFVMLIGVGTAWGQDPCSKTYNVCSGGDVVLTHDAAGCGNGGNFVWAAFEDDCNYYFNGVRSIPAYTIGNFGGAAGGGIGAGWGDGENEDHLSSTDENICHYPGSMTVDIKNSNSSDPYIYFEIPNGADPSIYKYFIIRYRVNLKPAGANLGNMEVFFYNSTNTDYTTTNNAYRVYSAEVQGSQSSKCVTNNYQHVVIDASVNPHWTEGTVTGFRLDPVQYNTYPNKQVHMSIDYIALVASLPSSGNASFTLNNVTENTTMKSYQINGDGTNTEPIVQNGTTLHNAGQIHYGWTSTESIHDVQVIAALNAGVIATGTATRCQGDETALPEIGEVTAASHETGATLSYKWYVSKDGGTPTVIPDATSTTFTPDIANYNTDPGVYVFTREVTSDLCETSPKTSTGTYALTVKPKPSVTVSNQTYYTNDGAQTVTLTSTPTGADFAWTNDNTAIGLAASGTGNVGPFTPTNTTSSDLVATITVTPTLDGCVGEDATFTITVKNSVTMNDITTFSAAACSGSIVTATFTSEIDGVSYSWSHNNTNVTPASGTVSADGVFSQAFTNNTSTAQTVTFTVTPTKGGITGPSKTFEVTINPLPTVTLSKTSVTVCAGESIEDITVTAANGTVSVTGLPNGVTYSDGVISGTPTASSTATVTVTSTDCGTATANLVVTVNPLPTVTLSKTSVTVCAGESIEDITVTAANGTVSVTGLPSGVTYADGVISGTPAASGTATVTVTSNTTPACGSDSKTLTITVNPLPTVTLSQTSATVCAGESIDNITVTAANGTVSVTGLPNGVTYSDGVISGTPTASGTATVTVTSNTTPACGSDYKTLTITVNPLPTVTLSQSSATVCAGESIDNITVTAANGTVSVTGLPAGVTYSDGVISGTPTASGTFNATVTVASNTTPACGSVNATLTITVNPLPDASITASATCICLGGVATFEATSGFASYSWSSGGTGGMPSATNTSSITVTPTAAGTINYQVTVEDANGCSNTGSAELVVKPLPNISANPTTQNITYGSAITPVQINAPTGATIGTSTLPGGLTYSSSVISGTPTNVGNYTITASATVEDCQATTQIFINVGKKPLTITYTGSSFVYDGYPVTLNYNDLTYTGLVTGDAFTSGTVTTQGYKVGDYYCTAGTFSRMWADYTATAAGFGPDEITAKYEPTFNVKITITQRPLEITANSASKVYDATPLMDAGWTYTNGTSLANTDAANVTVTGSQLCPGSSPNVVGAVTITHTSDNVDVTDCYNITKKNGTLTVTPLPCPATLEYEGYTYPLVQIDDQCWFAENLRAEIGNATPYDEVAANTPKFGMLYDWTDALNGNGTKKTEPCYGEYVQGACPDGWAIPSAADLDALQTYAHGMEGIRSDNPLYWVYEYLGNNMTGFDERGAGLLNNATGRYEELRSASYFWTSESILNPDAYAAGTALAYVDEYYCSEFIHKIMPQGSKLSVRCIQKTVPDVPVTSFNVEVNGPDKLTFCADDPNSVPATYTAVLTPAVSPATYQWYEDGSPISGAQSATYTKSYTSADAGTAVIKCEVTADGTTKDGSVSTQVIVKGPYSSENTLQICDCQLPYTYTVTKGSDIWTETWTADNIVTDPTRSHTFTSDDGCDSVVSITLETWSAANETPTTCTSVTTYNSNESGNGSGLETVTDVDGNVYHVVQIGDQCWMKENLRVTHFADGRALEPAYSVSDGNKANIYYKTNGSIYSKGPCDGTLTFDQHVARYGLMYNWYTAMDNANPDYGMTNVQGICPDGWHLPDTTEWQTLEAAAGFTGQHSQTQHIFVGTSAIQLVTGCEWKQSSVPGTPGDYTALGRNATNFSVRPAGCFLDTEHTVDGTHYNADQFAYAGIWAFFWSSTRYLKPNDSTFSDGKAAYNYDITFNEPGIARDVNGRDYLIGRSVRCIRNN